MIEALGLNVRASSDVRSLAYGTVTMPKTRRAIEAATGVSSELVRGMHLKVFDGSVLDLAGVRVGDQESVRRAEGREWVQFFGVFGSVLSPSMTRTLALRDPSN